ncbi:hypothetical protein H6G27_35335 [Nostoc linckia FACHB-104]|nr:hypothetical protein [Nostoc linckia FACHB-104]
MNKTIIKPARAAKGEVTNKNKNTNIRIDMNILNIFVTFESYWFQANLLTYTIHISNRGNQMYFFSTVQQK